jgi:hypothetical protein
LTLSMVSEDSNQRVMVLPVRVCRDGQGGSLLSVMILEKVTTAECNALDDQCLHKNLHAAAKAEGSTESKLSGQAPSLPCTGLRKRLIVEEDLSLST